MKMFGLAELLSPVPIRPATETRPAPMTRSEKLRHWAGLVRNYRGRYHLILFHGLEYLTPQQLRDARMPSDHPSAFGLAAADPKFRQQGLSSSPSVTEIMGFFELSQDQLHEFACDCGGHVSNGEMARRIDGLAA